jgi:integrase
MDGRGLMLVVSPAGARTWKLRFQLNGKRRDMGLGPYPEIKLAKARELALEARRLAKNGIDPIDRRTAMKKASKPIPKFKEIAALVIADAQAKSSNAKVRYQIARHLGETFCGPFLDKAVDTITTTDVAAVLRPIWDKKPEVARKVYPLIRRVFDRARVIIKSEHNVIMQENPAAWEDMKAHGFSKPKTLSRGHHPSLAYIRMPEFMSSLQRQGTMAARLSELAILTNVRCGAARQARWEDFDLVAAVWNVPLAHLKDREHRSEPFRIPLSEPAIHLLQDQARYRTSGLVFPSRGGTRTLSDMAASTLLKRMNASEGDIWKDEITGRPIVLHGFRATFRTWAEETGRFRHTTIEEAMGHVVGSAAERAYRRTDVFNLRRDLMNAWAAHCFPRNTFNVINMGARA